MKILATKLLSGVSLTATQRLVIAGSLLLVAGIGLIVLRLQGLEDIADDLDLGGFCAALGIVFLDLLQTSKRNSIPPPPPDASDKDDPNDPPVDVVTDDAPRTERDTDPCGPIARARLQTSPSFTVVGLGICLLMGCGASAIEAQSRAAMTAADVLRESKALIESELRERVTVCIDVNDTQPEAEACVEQAELRMREVIISQNLAADAHAVWVDALLAAHYSSDDVDWPALLALAARIVAAYDGLVTAAGLLNIHLPRLSAAVQP